MDWIQALILGIIQGLTEYLPVSSSGHLAIVQAIFGMDNGEDNLMFTVAVHVATVLSTLVVLWKEIAWILKGLFKFEMNAETKYVLNIIVSMIPVGIVGVFFLSADYRLSADILLLCQSATEREHLVEGRPDHRYRTGCSRVAGCIALRFYDCHRSDAG